jgi:alkyl hydroperoxide reductase subunit AhpC
MSLTIGDTAPDFIVATTGGPISFHDWIGAPNYPMIGDADFTISKAYGMLGAGVSGDPADRTAADNQTVRGVFVIGTWDEPKPYTRIVPQPA